MLNALNGVAPVRGGIKAKFPGPAGDEVEDYLTIWGLNEDTTSAIIIGMTSFVAQFNAFQCAKQANHTAGLTWNIAAGQRWVPGAGANVAWTSANLGAVDNNEHGTFFKDCVAAKAKSSGWVRDLAAARQVKHLSTESIQAYFMSQGETVVSGRRLKPIIDCIAQGIDTIMGSGLAQPDDSDWVRYHTTATSTPGLCVKVLAMLEDRLPGIVPANTVNDIGNAIAALHDKGLADRIPRRFVALTHAMLKAHNQLPDKWIQGEKAKAMMAANEYADFVAFSTRFASLATESRALGAAGTDAELLLVGQAVFAPELKDKAKAAAKAMIANKAVSEELRVMRMTDAADAQRIIGLVGGARGVVGPRVRTKYQIAREIWEDIQPAVLADLMSKHAMTILIVVAIFYFLFLR